ADQHVRVVMPGRIAVMVGDVRPENAFGHHGAGPGDVAGEKPVDRPRYRRIRQHRGEVDHGLVVGSVPGKRRLCTTTTDPCPTTIRVGLVENVEIAAEEAVVEPELRKSRHRPFPVVVYPML